ncbi:hypothetical protein [Microcystis aeruginosa]|nr:hypothetical protein [Microcystis aeruginosa]WOB70704.1 hypothetical protein PJW00_13390 [Microcystis aeruginosa LE3]
MQWTGVIRDRTLIEKDIGRFLSIVFDLERANHLNLLPDKDLVDLCHPIEPYQVTKSQEYLQLHQNLQLSLF